MVSTLPLQPRTKTFPQAPFKRPLLSQGKCSLTCPSLVRRAQTCEMGEGLVPDDEPRPWQPQASSRGGGCLGRFPASQSAPHPNSPHLLSPARLIVAVRELPLLSAGVKPLPATLGQRRGSPLKHSAGAYHPTSATTSLSLRSAFWAT